jgi:hypothetical protein
VESYSDAHIRAVGSASLSPTRLKAVTEDKYAPISSSSTCSLDSTTIKKINSKELDEFLVYARDRARGCTGVEVTSWRANNLVAATAFKVSMPCLKVRLLQVIAKLYSYGL